jgi:hypothetical protein
MMAGRQIRKGGWLRVGKVLSFLTIISPYLCWQGGEGSGKRLRRYEDGCWVLRAGWGYEGMGGGIMDAPKGWELECNATRSRFAANAVSYFHSIIVLFSTMVAVKKSR